ncbi:MAG: alpha/beta hydrolase [Gammaproteobacteria bacterium]|nr:alpha/beta hydrolase [Gammaproteobacteria bacterium]
MVRRATPGRPKASRKLSIDGPAGRLEALLDEPKQPASAVAVVCHPHPLHQGTMRNKVVHTLARAFNELELPVVRFNYRGVGASEGRYGDVVGETRDALAVVGWARHRWPGVDIWMGGFSFGAVVALRVALATEIAQLVTIAPPVEQLEPGGGGQPDCPWLIVQGDRDEVVDCEAVVAWVNELAPGPRLVVLEGVSHFFHGRLTELKETLVDILGKSGEDSDA